MIKMINRNAVFAALCALSTPVFAAGSIDVKVNGTIMPAGCTPSLSNGGVLDYGDIPFSQLSETNYTHLGVRDVSLTINCGAPIKFAIEAKNGRPGTLAGSSELGPNSVGAAPITLHGSSSQNAVVGLGYGTNNTKIGGYSILMKDVVADGSATAPIMSQDYGESWLGASGNANLYHRSAPVIVGAALNSGSRQIGAFKTVTATISVDSYINKQSELDLSSPVKLDGLTTLEIYYL